MGMITEREARELAYAFCKDMKLTIGSNKEMKLVRHIEAGDEKYTDYPNEKAIGLIHSNQKQVFYVGHLHYINGSSGSPRVRVYRSSTVIWDDRRQNIDVHLNHIAFSSVTASYSSNQNETYPLFVGYKVILE